MTQWRAFERLFGPITVQERVDVAGALAAWGSLASVGSKAAPPAFMPDWGKVAEQSGGQSVEDMIATLRAVTAKG